MEKNEQHIPWMFMGMEVRDVTVPEWAVSYVYLIEHQIGNRTMVYVGKKQLMSTRRKRIGVREKVATKTRKTFKVEKKDSGWSEYWGSSNSLKMARNEGLGTWKRTILYWCYSKKNATYLELRTQMLMRVLETESYNDNINGSIYRYDTDRLLYKEYRERRNKPQDKITDV